MWCVGGSPLSADLAAGFRDMLGSPLLDGYGLTELGNVAVAVPERPFGCGRPLPGVTVRITGVGGRREPTEKPAKSGSRPAARMEAI